MDNSTLYISLSQSTLVLSKKVHIEDIASIFCSNMDIAHEVGKIEIFTFNCKECGQQVVSAMKLIKLIYKKYNNVNVENIGSPETIVYYKEEQQSKGLIPILKSVFFMLIALLGTSYSIMSYDNDVDANKLLANLYTFFTSKSPENHPFGVSMGIIGYSLGLFIGMVIFFNHGINRNNIDDPSPLQVQMRLYEQDVNTCITIDSARKKQTLDVK